MGYAESLDGDRNENAIRTYPLIGKIFKDIKQ